MISKLYLMPTQKCNCNCTYCYIPSNERNKKAGYTFMKETVEQFIAEIKQHQLQNQAEIRFIGGEPYLEIETVAKLSKLFLSEIDTGKIVINSNGTLILDKHLDLFNNSYLIQITHILSLDGKEEKHNARRKLKNQKNAFESTTQGLKLLQARNMPVYLNMVLDEYTIEGINDFMKYLKNHLNINKLSVSLLYQPDKQLNAIDKFNLLERVYKYAAENKILIGGHHRLLLGKEIPEFMCRAGEQTILLSGDQKIYACQRFVGREEAEIFSKALKFSNIKCNSCVERSCYSSENLELGKKLHHLYKTKYPQYLKVNDFDRILFGVL